MVFFSNLWIKWNGIDYECLQPMVDYPDDGMINSNLYRYIKPSITDWLRTEKIKHKIIDDKWMPIIRFYSKSDLMYFRMKVSTLI